MKDFKTIFLFEAKAYFNKTFIVMGVLYLVGLIGGIFAMQVFSETISSEDAADKDRLLVNSSAIANPEVFLDQLRLQLPNYSVESAADSVETLKEKISDEEIAAAVFVDSEKSLTYYVNSLGSAFNFEIQSVSDALAEAYKINALVDSGKSVAEAAQISAVPIEAKTVELKESNSLNYFGFLAILLIFDIVIAIAGNILAMEIAKEKGTRIYESMISGINVVSLFWGKILAVLAFWAAFLLVYVGSAAVIYLTNKEKIGEILKIVAVMFDAISAYTVIWFAVFLLLGIFLYTILYAAAAATVSKYEDLGVATLAMGGILTAVVVISEFMVIGLWGGADSMFMKILSYIPLTSPIAMMARFSVAPFAWWELAISAAVLALSIIGAGILGGKIYRTSILLYGGKPGLLNAVKAFRRA